MMNYHKASFIWFTLWGSAMTTITSNYANYNNYNDYQSGNYQAENGWWGSAGGSSEYFTVNSTFPNATTFNWDWPSASNYGPVAFPSVTYVNQWAAGTENGAGRSPGSLYANEVPTTISNISTLTATYNVSLGGNSTYNDVCFDIWLTAPGSHNLNWTTVGPETELMIMVQTPPSWGGTGGSFTAGGIVNGELQVQEGGNGSVNWQQDVVYTPQPMLSGTLDINAIMKQLVAMGDLNSNEQISNITFGSEVSGNTGSMTVNQFSVDWQNSGSTTPTPPTAIASTVHDAENVAYTFALSNFGYSDPNGTTDALANIKVTSLPTSGTLEDNGVAVTAGQTISAADISSGHLTFMPVANSLVASSFNFSVTDTVNNLTSTTPAAMTIDISSTVPPTVSPSGTIVQNNSSSHITDSAYNLWTVTNGIVDENSKPAGYSAHVTEIAYVSGLVYQENSSGHWWDWTGSTWASTSNPFHHH
jgi:hypothetical protein